MSTTAFTPEAMRARFEELTALQAERQKLYDDAVAKYHEATVAAERTLAEAEERLKKVRTESDLYNIKQELAIITRALGGRTANLTSEEANTPDQTAAE